MNKLKVGDTTEVIEITRSGDYPLYSKGNTGIITKIFNDGSISAFVGGVPSEYNGWFVGKRSYKQVGRLTVTKVK